MVSHDSNSPTTPAAPPDAAHLRIEAVLDEFRPRLGLDGCGVAIVELAASGTLRLRMTGRNSSCPMALFLLKACLEQTLRDRVPEVKQVELQR